MTDIEHLAGLALFRNLSTDELRTALAESRPRKVAQGEFFFMQEDPAEAMYVLRKGSVKLAQLSLDGQQIILGVQGPWNEFGMISIVPDAAYPVSAEAVSDCEALRWDQAALQRLAGRSLNFALNIMGQMAGHVRDYQARVRELSLERVERRLARLLLRLAQQVGQKQEDGILINMTISRQDAAEMSGTTLFTVSRIFSRWEKEGLIEAGRERIVIRFPHGLVRIAEDLP